MGTYTTDVFFKAGAGRRFVAYRYIVFSRVRLAESSLRVSRLRTCKRVATGGHAHGLRWSVLWVRSRLYTAVVFSLLPCRSYATLAERFKGYGDDDVRGFGFVPQRSATTMSSGVMQSSAEVHTMSTFRTSNYRSPRYEHYSAVCSAVRFCVEVQHVEFAAPFYSCLECDGALRGRRSKKTFEKYLAQSLRVVLE